MPSATNKYYLKNIITLAISVGPCFSAYTHNLVNIHQINSTIVLDIKYATTHNFTKQKIYSHAVCYLVKPAALQLDKVQKELRKLGLSLLIWDGYRPLSAQKIFWHLVPDERYVANPALGSRHNRGCAVDCTLVTQDGKLLEMPTDFDDFSIKAHRNYAGSTKNAQKNRELLETIMGKHGFVGLPTEWWHFDYKDWQQYPILDIAFSCLT